ncbi:hypothetical protein A6A28_31335 [Streptomyces sp. CB03578]|uniref:arylamine N-acetyltransferase family protein n=1 Tax=Streptomyces sp. CB03578 TaxID=1718987 RepID=UPI00093A3172|nr:arylamine N-acetyltransferase [Streptomyces sp. CB03578]OKI38097.1 hypothetical protein A6A28_31335 [Streptomyces sp. CB03578]
MSATTATTALSRSETAAFLDRLGGVAAGPPSVAALHRLHGAFLEHVPYETLDIQLGRRTGIDPLVSVDRIVRLRRGGYCFQLNGAFAVLLRSLGYRVTLHQGGVHRPPKGRPAIDGSHLTLTVDSLPDDPGGRWLVDVGLGDGFYAPLPLRRGRFVQGGILQARFRFELAASEVRAGAWQLRHPDGSGFTGMDFDPAPASMADFERRHAYFSTSSDTHFRQLCTVMRRHAAGSDVLRALTLTRQARSTVRQTLERREDWFAALDEVFGLPLGDLSKAERDLLWRRVVRQHEAFLVRQSRRCSA